MLYLIYLDVKQERNNKSTSSLTEIKVWKQRRLCFTTSLSTYRNRRRQIRRRSAKHQPHPTNGNKIKLMCHVPTQIAYEWYLRNYNFKGIYEVVQTLFFTKCTSQRVYMNPSKDIAMFVWNRVLTLSWTVADTWPQKQ